MKEITTEYKTPVGEPGGEGHLEDLGIDDRNIHEDKS
jgi:hypothetical protein